MRSRSSGATSLRTSSFTHPYAGVDWADVGHHWSQFHLHVPRVPVTADWVRAKTCVRAELLGPGGAVIDIRPFFPAE